MRSRIPAQRLRRLPTSARHSVRFADLLGLPPIRWQMLPVRPVRPWSAA